MSHQVSGSYRTQVKRKEAIIRREQKKYERRMQAYQELKQQEAQP